MSPSVFAAHIIYTAKNRYTGRDYHLPDLTCGALWMQAETVVLCALSEGGTQAVHTMQTNTVGMYPSRVVSYAHAFPVSFAPSSPQRHHIGECGRWMRLGCAVLGVGLSRTHSSCSSSRTLSHPFILSFHG